MELIAASNSFDTVNGLPVHVLVVHAVVVLLPLSALGAILMGIIPKLSIRFGPLVVLGALVAFGACFVAERSGKALAQRVGTPQEHMQLGEQVKFYAAALVIITAILWVVDRQSGGARGALGWIFAILAILAGLAALYGTFKAGDSGSQAVWGSIIKNTDP